MSLIGKTATDKVSGFNGTITRTIEELGMPTQHELTANVKASGDSVITAWFVEGRLNIDNNLSEAGKSETSNHRGFDEFHFDTKALDFEQALGLTYERCTALYKAVKEIFKEYNGDIKSCTSSVYSKLLKLPTSAPELFYVAHLSGVITQKTFQASKHTMGILLQMLSGNGVDPEVLFKNPFERGSKK